MPLTNRNAMVSFVLMTFRKENPCFVGVVDFPAHKV